MGPRIFTAREATAQIPDVVRAFEAVDAVRQRLRTYKGKLDVLEMIWGEELQNPSNPDHREFQHYLEEIEKTKKDYESALQKFGELDAMVKSVDTGLVDFYGVIDSRLVFLCWKRGERAVEYYHHLEDGFAGRQPIPAEELAK